MKRRFVSACKKNGRYQATFEQRRFPWSRWRRVDVFLEGRPYWRRLSDGVETSGAVGEWLCDQFVAAVARGEVVDHDETEGRDA